VGTFIYVARYMYNIKKTYAFLLCICMFVQTCPHAIEFHITELMGRSDAISVQYSRHYVIFSLVTGLTHAAASAG
jgi:hypothetical protein